MPTAVALEDNEVLVFRGDEDLPWMLGEMPWRPGRTNLEARLDPADRSLIEDFLADPIAWSTRHGGRSMLQSRRR